MRQVAIPASMSPLSFLVFMTQAHPGFAKVAQTIAKKGGYSSNEARAILASRTRNASPAAKKANPNLKKVT